MPSWVLPVEWCWPTWELNSSTSNPLRGIPPGGLRGFGLGFFPFFSRNKKSLALNIKSEEGREILLKLIPQVDVLIENFGPGTMDRLGYGYQALSKIDPHSHLLRAERFSPGSLRKASGLGRNRPDDGGIGLYDRASRPTASRRIFHRGYRWSAVWCYRDPAGIA